MAAHSPGSGENYSLGNNSVYPGEQYCQATGTGDGDGNGKVTPVPGDDIIILGATTNHHISPIRLPQNQYFQSISVGCLEVIGRDCSHQGIICFRRNPALSSSKVQMTDDIL